MPLRRISRTRPIDLELGVENTIETSRCRVNPVQSSLDPMYSMSEERKLLLTTEENGVPSHPPSPSGDLSAVLQSIVGLEVPAGETSQFAQASASAPAGSTRMAFRGRSIGPGLAWRKAFPRSVRMICLRGYCRRAAAGWYVGRTRRPSVRGEPVRR